MTRSTNATAKPASLGASLKLKTAIVSLVAIFFASVGSSSYARGHNDHTGKIIAGALIGTVVGLSLANHNRGHRFKHHYHGGNKCHKRHRTNSHRYNNNHNHRNGHGHHYNKRSDKHANGHHGGYSRHSDRQVHHYYNEKHQTRRSHHDDRRGGHKNGHRNDHKHGHQNNRNKSHSNGHSYSSSRNSEGYVSVRSF